MKKNPNFLGVEKGIWAGVLIGGGIAAPIIGEHLIGVILFVGGLILWYLPLTEK